MLLLFPPPHSFAPCGLRGQQDKPARGRGQGRRPPTLPGKQPCGGRGLYCSWSRGRQRGLVTVTEELRAWEATKATLSPSYPAPFSKHVRRPTAVNMPALTSAEAASDANSIPEPGSDGWKGGVCERGGDAVSESRESVFFPAEDGGDGNKGWVSGAEGAPALGRLSRPLFSPPRMVGGGTARQKAPPPSRACSNSGGFPRGAALISGRGVRCVRVQGSRSCGGADDAAAVGSCFPGSFFVRETKGCKSSRNEEHLGFPAIAP